LGVVFKRPICCIPVV